jgi:hypothetical protein
MYLDFIEVFSRSVAASWRSESVARGRLGHVQFMLGEADRDKDVEQFLPDGAAAAGVVLQPYDRGLQVPPDFV